MSGPALASGHVVDKKDALDPSQPPDVAPPSIIAGPADAADVPPPPAQLDALLAAFETDAPNLFPTGSAEGMRRQDAPTTAASVDDAGGPTASIAKRRSSVLRIVAIAAGALVAAGITWGISIGKIASGRKLASAAPSSTAASAAGTASSEVPATPASALSPSDETAPSRNATIADERVRTPAAKPAGKTVRAPAAPRLHTVRAPKAVR